MSENDKDLLENNGWIVECESPLEIRSENGESFASGLAAQFVIESLRENDPDII